MNKKVKAERETTNDGATKPWQPRLNPKSDMNVSTQRPPNGLFLKAVHLNISFDEALPMRWHNKENGVPLNHALKSSRVNAFNTLHHTLVGH